MSLIRIGGWFWSADQPSVLKRVFNAVDQDGSSDDTAAIIDVL